MSDKELNAVIYFRCKKLVRNSYLSRAVTFYLFLPGQYCSVSSRSTVNIWLTVEQIYYFFLF